MSFFSNTMYLVNNDTRPYLTLASSATNTPATVYLENNGTSAPDCLYSLNKKTWTQMPTDSASAVSFTGNLYIKGTNTTTWSTDSTNYSRFVITASSGSVSISGSILSLLDAGEETHTGELADYCFYKLFQGQAALGTSSLSGTLTELGEGSCQYMFQSCGYISAPLDLSHVTSIDSYSCYGMFSGCTAGTFTTAPWFSDSITELPANSCNGMFYGCTKLTTPPDMSKIVALNEYCCYQMFYGCSSITTAPWFSSSVTAIPNNACTEMFYSCTKLATPPDTSHVVSLGNSAFKGMLCSTVITAPIDMSGITTINANACWDLFWNCKKLETPPTFSSSLTTVNSYSFRNMFGSCESLKTVPDMTHITSIAGNSCYGMFSNCKTLTTACDFNSSITTLSGQQYMFQNCTKLTTFPTSWSQITTLSSCPSMFKGCTTLADASAISGLTSISGCDHMFQNCTALETAPDLSNIASLNSGALTGFYQGCTNLTGPVYVPKCSPLVSSTSVCVDMFTDAGTIHPVSTATASDCYIIAPTGTSDWNETNCGISSTYWTVKNVVISNYLTFEGVSGTFSSLQFVGGANIEYSSDGTTWDDASSATAISVSNGKVYLRGKTGSTSIYHFTGAFTKVSGDLRCLIDYTDPDNASISANQFFYEDTSFLTIRYGLFYIYNTTPIYNTTLTDVSDLTIPNLDDGATDAYKCMFMNCSALTGTVYLPDTPLISGGTTSACTDMFTGTAGGTMYTANPTEWTSSDAGIDTTVWNVVTATTSASVSADSAASL